MIEQRALPNEAATTALARALAPHLRKGDLVALWGGLGAGKTTLCRALISALRGKDSDVPSPTYTLVQTYDAGSLPIFHFDLYRLNTPDELDEIGWEDSAEGLALVEWPGKAGDRLPAWRLDLTLEKTGDSRIARLEPRGEDWQTRLDGFDV